MMIAQFKPIANGIYTSPDVAAANNSTLTAYE
jgi:hypothetical protein